MFRTKIAALAALLAAGTGVADASGATRFRHEPSTAAVVQNKAGMRRAAARTGEEGAIWRAKHENISEWFEGDWVPIEAYTMTYNDRGLTVREIFKDLDAQDYTLTENTYDANDMRVREMKYLSEDGQVYYNYSKKENGYDAVVTDFVTAKYEWFWRDDDWAQIGNNWERTITRDDKGNITAVQTAVLFMGIFDPTIQLVVEYGDDGKACRIEQKNLDYDGSNYFWRTSATITDIVWEETDGQITEIGNFTTGSNRMKSAHMTDAENDVDFTAEYTENGFKSVRKGTVQNQKNTTATIEVTYLDSYGSNKLVETFSQEKNGEVHTESYTDITMYDAYGYTTLISNVESYPDRVGDMITEETGRLEGILTYDETYGYPLTYVTSRMVYDEDTDTPVMQLEILAEFSDYEKFSAGIEGVGTDSTDSAARYYNLQGIEVDASHLAPGIYIVRQGNKSHKTLVR